MHAAHYAGLLPPAKTLLCVDCGAQAQEYHHHNGYEPEHLLDVIPVCRACHGKRHTAEGRTRTKGGTPQDDSIALSVMIPKSDKRALEQLARMNGNVSLAGIVRKLIRNELDRQTVYAIADGETEAYLREAR
jgi:hypothetical protein